MPRFFSSSIHSKPSRCHGSGATGCVSSQFSAMSISSRGSGMKKTTKTLSYSTASTALDDLSASYYSSSVRSASPHTISGFAYQAAPQAAAAAIDEWGYFVDFQDPSSCFEGGDAGRSMLNGYMQPAGERSSRRQLSTVPEMAL